MVYKLRGYWFFRYIRDPMCAKHKNTGNTLLSLNVYIIPLYVTHPHIIYRYTYILYTYLYIYIYIYIYTCILILIKIFCLLKLYYGRMDALFINQIIFETDITVNIKCSHNFNIIYLIITISIGACISTIIPTTESSIK